MILLYEDKKLKRQEQQQQQHHSNRLTKTNKQIYSLLAFLSSFLSSID
jgi:hypothetical protein